MSRKRSKNLAKPGFSAVEQVKSDRLPAVSHIVDRQPVFTGDQACLIDYHSALSIEC